MLVLMLLLLLLLLCETAIFTNSNGRQTAIIKTEATTTFKYL